MSHPRWMLGTKFGSSANTVNAPQVLSPAPICVVLRQDLMWLGGPQTGCVIEDSSELLIFLPLPPKYTSDVCGHTQFPLFVGDKGVVSCCFSWLNTCSKADYSGLMVYTYQAAQYSACVTFRVKCNRKSLRHHWGLSLFTLYLKLGPPG